jgi:tetratricopeptide (TPR) repeat protein
LPTVGEAFQQAQELHAAGRLAEAEVIYRQLTAALPGAAEVWGRLGIFYLEARRPDAAVEPLVQATLRDPANGAFHSALGEAYRLLKRPREAVASFQRALDIGPRDAQRLNNLALAQKDAGQSDEALANFDAAVALVPDYQTGHFNRGNLLLGMGRPAEAIVSYRRAIELKPDDAGAYCSLGVAHFDLARLDDAMAALERALELQPNYPEARRNQALVWFLRGEYSKAWPAFEARLQCDDFAQRDFPQPRWDGSPLAGQTLLVYAEQALGDVLQFVRYLPPAARVAKRVWFEPHEALRPLLVQSGFGEFLVERDSRPPFDVHASLLSLAGHLPNAGGEPYWGGAYLKADPRLVERWKHRLADISGVKVGIVWAGNPDHPHDRFRSTRLANFGPLAAIAGVRLISLQKGAGREQLAEHAGDMNIIDFGDELDAADRGAFMDTAAVIVNLDLVIAIDTSVAHLAGGLGKPVWLALQYAPDWRWRLRGEDTPWYPETRLFRQRALDDWQGVFAEMTVALGRLRGH